MFENETRKKITKITNYATNAHTKKARARCCWLCDSLTLFHFYAMNYCQMYLSIISKYALFSTTAERENQNKNG